MVIVFILSNDRNYVAKMRVKLSSYLSGSIYGNCISFDEAYKELK